MLRFATLVLVAVGAAAQRPGPGGSGGTCASGAEGATLSVGCASGGVINSVVFAEYGSVTGQCPGMSAGTCGTNVLTEAKTACVGQSVCSVHCSHSDTGCVEGKGKTCGCAFTSGSAKTPGKFLPIPDPCPGKKKTQGLEVTCNTTAPGPVSGSASVAGLRVNSLESPITIDDLRPHFSWKLDGGGQRAVLSEGYELVLSQGGKHLWASGKVTGNRTSYVPLPAGAPALASDTSYEWSVRGYVGGAATAWANANFSTALLEQSDWGAAEWITTPGGDAPGQYASQMRKVFTLPADFVAAKGRVFLALPGYGELFVNGVQVDNPETGSRSLSQYDVRMLYHSYDCTAVLKPGSNVIAVYVGLGWWGHPAVPPQAKRFPFGPPTLRLLLLAHAKAGGAPTVVGTDSSWEQTQGPVIYDDEYLLRGIWEYTQQKPHFAPDLGVKVCIHLPRSRYNGQTYDARLETPGWTTATATMPSPLWTSVVKASTQPKFALGSSIMSSAAFQPIKALGHVHPDWMRYPAPGVYVYDFLQNEPGWCKLSLTCEAGVVVQLRHAEVLQHPPYGPEDGNVYVGNLRSAKATDVYVCKGDPDGESVEFMFTQHGFRYVELTFPGFPNQPPPTLETLTAIFTRSAVDIAGDLTFSDKMLQDVHHNYLWGQASNLMMVPSDCDNRDERFGWTGDSALTCDEASVNFDLSSFYDSWARMLDDSSQNGAVACWVPGGVGHSSPPAHGSCDSSWGSAFPSVVYAQFKWNGDVIGPLARWKGITRYIDNDFNKSQSNGKTNATQFFSGLGDWVPPTKSPDNPAFVPTSKVTSKFTAGFSLTRDIAHVVEMARALEGKGLPAGDLAKYTAMYKNILSAFHQAWWDPVKKIYADGGQTAHSLALTLDAESKAIGVPGLMPTAAVKEATLHKLVTDIIANGNHTTCGIIGWRFQPYALSSNGYGELAYALMTQTTYPSIGYEIIGKTGEPATTLWELWNSDEQGPSMNSRNHIMFGGNGVWLHTYVGGINNAPGSIGYEHVTISPPASLIKAAVSKAIKAPGDTTSAPLTWTSAAKETLRGEFALFWSLGNSTLTVDVTVPANALATTIVPLVGGGAQPTITEGAAKVWEHGSYVSGVKGIRSAAKDGDTIQIEHGSGNYHFVVEGF